MTSMGWGKFLSQKELEVTRQGVLQRAAAATAKSLQLCPTLCDPIDGSLPGSPSLGFSRQEYWSGLPFPSPMHESEKLKLNHSVMSHSYSPPGSSVHGTLQARVLEWGAIAFSDDKPR